MNHDELTNQSDDNVLLRRDELTRELVKFRLQLRSGTLENTSKLRKTKRSLARVNTELRKRECLRDTAKGALLSKAAPRLEPAETVSESVSPAAKKSRFGLGFLKSALFGKRGE